MHLKVRLLVVIYVMVDISVAPKAPAQYLGPKPSAKYVFPWLVTFHHLSSTTREFFGSGSILTPRWVLGSMDTFIRKSKFGRKTAFYLDIENILVFAGGIFVELPTRNEDLPPWIQLRKMEEIHMFSKPDWLVASRLKFTRNEIPAELNDLGRSPFGFNMTIAIIKVREFKESGSPAYDYKKIILPIPLNFGNGISKEVRISLQMEFDSLEKQPFGLLCHVGGWRNSDRRLVGYEVVYVPFDQCENIFCSNDRRACFKWPVRGTHACFKSLTFTDLCWRDQGSALYCEKLSESVIGILTTAPTCGSGGLPGVYTLINHGLELLELTVPSGERYKPIPKSDLLGKFGVPNEKDLIPFD